MVSAWFRHIEFAWFRLGFGSADLLSLGLVSVQRICLVSALTRATTVGGAIALTLVRFSVTSVSSHSRIIH